MSLIDVFQKQTKTDIQSVGLDVCKDSVRVCFWNHARTIDYEIGNNSQEIQKFCLECKEVKIKKKIPFIIESTWDYHLLLALELRKSWCNVKEINPIMTKQYTRTSVRGTKTDKTDAVILWKIGSIEWTQLKSFERTEENIELKKKIWLIANLEKQLQSMKATIKRYHECLKKLWMVKDHEKDLWLDEIKSIDKLIKKLQKDIEKYMFEKEEDNEKVQYISSIVWVSDYMAKVFYIQFANKEFKTKDAMYAFVWCEPKLKQSWTKSVGVRMSKRGNWYTRKKLYQSAYCATHHCKELGKLYDRMKEKWKHHYIALNVVMKKLVHIIRSLLKHKNYFNPALV